MCRLAPALVRHRVPRDSLAGRGGGVRSVARFAELAHNSTAILISHRFSTVRKASRIVVLEGGGIREQGTHDQLVMIRGRYARLFELQAANYR